MKTTKTLLFIFTTVILGGCDAPVMKAYAPPVATAWAPTRLPHTTADDSLHASRAAFRTLHSTSYNSDEVWTAYPVVFAKGWTAEPAFFVPEGPSFDDAGNLYLSPLLPRESVLLVSLDPRDGKRRWAIPGKRAGSGGAPLILQDPAQPGAQIIYAGSYDSLYAVRTDGTVLWDRPTGLTAPADPARVLDTHNYGVNYLPRHDALLSIMGDGHLVAHRRSDGIALATPLQLPGAPAASSGTATLPAVVRARADALLAPLFDDDVARGGSITDTLTKALLGDGALVSNYFSIDPDRGTIWIASTAPDEADGVVDGVAAWGALYAWNLEGSNGSYRFVEQCHVFYPGGSASTPTLRADGERVYVGDSERSLLAYDRQCRELWRTDVGSQIVGSVGVSQDNDEIYAATGTQVIRIEDAGTEGRIIWRAAMDMYRLKPGQSAGNLNLAGIGANGVVVHVGAGLRLRGQMLPLSVGVALIDRNTGKVRYAAPGPEETVSVMSSNIDGTLYLGHSPFRRALALALTGSTAGVTGGVGQYRDLRPDLLAREAVCAAARRLAMPTAFLAAAGSPEERATHVNRDHALLLLQQAEQALQRSQADTAITSSVTHAREALLNRSEDAARRSAEACRATGG